MMKRSAALLLAAGVAVGSLTGCWKSGSSSAAAESGSNVTTTNGFFKLVEQLRKEENFTFQLEDKLNAEHTVTIAGSVFGSEKQAQFTVTIDDNQAYTDVIVDDTKLYYNAKAVATYLEQTYSALEEDPVMNDALGGMADGIGELGSTLSADYVLAELDQNPWDMLQGDGSGWYELATELYDTLKDGANAYVSELEDGSYQLSMSGEALQTERLTLLNGLIDQKTVYQEALTKALDANASDLVEGGGWTAQDLLDNKWGEYEDSAAELNDLKDNGEWDENCALSMTAAYDKSSKTYTMNAVWINEKENTTELSLTVNAGAAAQKVTVPEKTMAQADVATDVMDLQMYTRTLYSVVVLGYTGEYEGAETEEVISLDGSSSAVPEEPSAVKLTATANKLVSNMAFVTEDSVAVEVPTLNNYDGCQYDMLGNDDIYSFSSYTDGWEISSESLLKNSRTAKEIAETEASSGAETQSTDWGYEIKQKASAASVSSDGTVAVSGYGYYDKDVDCEVTMVYLVQDVKDSEYVICTELKFYAPFVLNDDVAAIGAMMKQQGLTLPVNIAQSE